MSNLIIYLVGVVFFIVYFYLEMKKTKENETVEVSIINPYKLDNERRFVCKGYKNLKKTYTNSEIILKKNNSIRGRKVKYWKMVSCHGDQGEGNEYIPIFYK